MRKYIADYFRRTDKYLWTTCFAASIIGFVLLYGILQTGYQDYLDISRRNLFVQMAASAVGCIGAVVISLIDYRFVKKLWWLHTAIVYALVFLTFFIGVGAALRPDDKRWLILPVVDVFLQPAELLKLSFILTFALHISKTGETLNRLYNMLLLCLHAGAAIALIHFQGDDGTALLILGIAVVMLFYAGIDWKYVAAGIAGLAVSIPILWYNVLDEFQKTRILTLFNQDTADPLGEYYQQYQAKVAIATGGMTGKGLLGVKHIYIPEMHNDFIFAFLCESFGFMGALGVFVIMCFMCFKMLYNTRLAADKYGALVCAGVFGMLAFQIMINIGMCLSILPVIGNTFPFLSYGGTSAVTGYLGIGMVQSIYMRQNNNMF